MKMAAMILSNISLLPSYVICKCIVMKYCAYLKSCIKDYLLRLIMAQICVCMCSLIQQEPNITSMLKNPHGTYMFFLCEYNVTKYSFDSDNEELLCFGKFRIESYDVEFIQHHFWHFVFKFPYNVYDTPMPSIKCV